MQKNLKNKKIN